MLTNICPFCDEASVVPLGVTKQTSFIRFMQEHECRVSQIIREAFLIKTVRGVELVSMYENPMYKKTMYRNSDIETESLYNIDVDLQTNLIVHRRAPLDIRVRV